MTSICRQMFFFSLTLSKISGKRVYSTTSLILRIILHPSVCHRMTDIQLELIHDVDMCQFVEVVELVVELVTSLIVTDKRIISTWKIMTNQTGQSTLHISMLTTCTAGRWANISQQVISNGSLISKSNNWTSTISNMISTTVWFSKFISSIRKNCMICIMTTLLPRRK